MATTTREVSRLAGWFGSDTMIAPYIGAALDGCSWVGIPFAGGLGVVRHITARTILANDLHRLIMNLAAVTRSNDWRPVLIRRLRKKLFHPDELLAAQIACRQWEAGDVLDVKHPNIDAAEDYFVACWMNRGAKAGIDGEFNGRTSVRWKSDGGDSNVRFRSAIRMLGSAGRDFRRCTFETMDALTEFLPRCEDLDGHGVYADPPFPEAGRRYRHNAGQTDAEERAWHTRLRDALLRFDRTRIVCRFYEHPLIRELYPPSAGWEWKPLEGRKQSNSDADEVLLVRNRPAEKARLF